MYKITFEDLIERLSEELTSHFDYSFINPEDGMVIFESSKTSEFGDHTLLFNTYACTCNGINYYIGQPKGLKNLNKETLIRNFVSGILDKILMEISEGGLEYGI